MDAEAPSKPGDPFVPTTDTEMTEAQTEESAKKSDTSAKEGASVEPADGNPTATTTEAPDANGAATPDPSEESAQAAGQTQEKEDTQMEDPNEPLPPAEPPSSNTAASDAPAANGTPATNKRASVGGSSRKRSSAVPEHKSKKVNKKKSRPLTHLDAQPGEYYFARMKGHPPWPSIICDESMLPHSLLSTRPVTAALKDGSFKKADYADGGKRAYERTFPVMFLHTNEFAWIPNTELTPLDAEADDIKNPTEKGKSKTLLAAYAKAAEANDLEAFKTMLLEHEKAIQDDLALQEERSAKKVEKARRAAARKSSDAKIDEDEMDIDDEAGPEKSKSKKRKKAADESDADEKPAKTPKMATKLKLSTPKQPAESATKKKPQKPKVKTATRSGSDEEAQTPKVDEKPLSPGALKEIKEKKVLYYRHKLQRGFLSRDTVPKAEEMKGMSDFLSELEAYPDLEGSIIRTTKIHKVLKQMIKLEHIPLEEEFKFKDRSSKLLAKWNDTLSNDLPADEKTDEKADEKAETKTEDKTEQPKTGESPAGQEPAPTVNGNADSKDESKDVQAEQEDEPGKAGATETEPSSRPDYKIGTEVEAEKEAGAEKPTGGDEMEVETTAKEKESDAPAVDEAPAEEYKPPTEEATDATA